MSKYKAVRAEADGITFHSTKERNRYLELRLLEKAGVVQNIKLQPSFSLRAAGQPLEVKPLGAYRGDFSYEESYTVNGIVCWREVVEDVKGYDTPLSRWKRRHVALQYGIEVQCV
jgi:hypothetical protein